MVYWWCSASVLLADVFGVVRRSQKLVQVRGIHNAQLYHPAGTVGVFINQTWVVIQVSIYVHDFAS